MAYSLVAYFLACTCQLPFMSVILLFFRGAKVRRESTNRAGKYYKNKNKKTVSQVPMDMHSNPISLPSQKRIFGMQFQKFTITKISPTLFYTQRPKALLLSFLSCRLKLLLHHLVPASTSAGPAFKKETKIVTGNYIQPCMTKPYGCTCPSTGAKTSRLLNVAKRKHLNSQSLYITEWDCRSGIEPNYCHK